MKIIGVTGGSGAGKSVLLSLWASKGAAVFNADSVYHGLLQTSRPLSDALRQAFPAAFSKDILDRRALAAIVFSDEPSLRRLNGITHPIVVAELRRLLQAERERGTELAVVEAIYLVESGVALLCDDTVAVTAPAALRLERICARDGLDEASARQRLCRQQDDAFYRAHCGHVLVNDGDAETLAKNAESLWSALFR